MAPTEEVFSSSTQVCTERRLHWNPSPKQIQRMISKLIAKTKKVYDAVGSLDLDSVTFSNTLKALADMEAEYTVQKNMLGLLSWVSPRKEVRPASEDAYEKMVEFEADLNKRKDVYQRIEALGMKADEGSLTTEDKRYIERQLLVRKRFQETQDNTMSNLLLLLSCIIVLDDWLTTLYFPRFLNLHGHTTKDGVHLPEEKQDELECLTSLTFSRDELGGLPEDFLSSLEEDGDKLKITLEPNNYLLAMEKCFVPETRKKVEEAFNSDCKENSVILKDLSELRAQRSTLQGFKTYADFVLKTNVNMAKSAKEVSIFLDELAHKLKPLADKERANLLKLKEDECLKRGLPFNGELYEWDMPYYMKNHYGVDHNRLKEYFPLKVVTQGLLDICQDLLGLSFSLVHGAPVWHPDVTLYCVTDRSSGETVGQFYLDLFTREGKSLEEACSGYCFPLQPSCLLSDGSRQMAVAALVTKFSKPTTNGPSLLTHDEVVTYFHEFGHVMHYLCAQVDYAAFSAFDMEEDFGEAPSQMLENWVWEREPLQRISKHYETGAPIPDELFDDLVKSRLAYTGMVNLSMVVLAKLDQALHTQTGLDPANECLRLSKDILGVPVFRGKNVIALIDQVAGGSGARLYGHLWGEVLAMDMFYSRFKQEGIMNPKVGMDYRNCILKPGASKDAKEMLRNFLGREPNQEAFLLSKGIAVSELKKHSF